MRVLGAAWHREGPSTVKLEYYIFVKFYREQDYAVASAAAYVLFLITFLLTLIQLWIGRRRLPS
ncbi:MAG: hypothetical protein IMX05_00230 [Hydrogenibacillus schlegelii]|nr:hypothetical protein [Hydrogenibacillus schlegelii]